MSYQAILEAETKGNIVILILSSNPYDTVYSLFAV